MKPQPKRWLLPVALCLFAPAAFAQDAYIAQLGDANGAANVDFGRGNTTAIAQYGDANSAAQFSAGINNSLGTAQIGVGNSNLSVVAGRNNQVGTAQLGLQNSSSTLVAGSGNSVGTLQVGAFHRSNVAVYGNQAQVGVMQTGLGRETNLLVVDQMIGASGGSAPGLTAGQTATGGLQVGVRQGGFDAPVNAMVGRDAVGNIIVRPGTATTVLTF